MRQYAKRSVGLAYIPDVGTSIGAPGSYQAFVIWTVYVSGTSGKRTRINSPPYNIIHIQCFTL
jgi:hypothetical protein